MSGGESGHVKMDQLVIAAQGRRREVQVGIQFSIGDGITDILRHQEIAAVLQVFFSLGEDAPVAAQPDRSAAAVGEENGGHLSQDSGCQVGGLKSALRQRRPAMRLPVIFQFQELG